MVVAEGEKRRVPKKEQSNRTPRGKAGKLALWGSRSLVLTYEVWDDNWAPMWQCPARSWAPQE
jgi:hypothetical protein